MNCWDHALCKALPCLSDLLASYSTKIEKASVHVFTEKLLIAMHFVLLSSTNANRAGVWVYLIKQNILLKECSWSRSHKRILLLFQKEQCNLSRISPITPQTDEAPSMPKSQMAI